MHPFRDMNVILVENRQKNLPDSHLARSFGVTPCEFFDDSYLARNWNHGAIRRCTFHDPAFALLGTIPACDRRTDGHVAVAKTRHSIYAAARKNQLLRRTEGNPHWLSDIELSSSFSCYRAIRAWNRGKCCGNFVTSSVRHIRQNGTKKLQNFKLTISEVCFRMVSLSPLTLCRIDWIEQITQ